MPAPLDKRCKQMVLSLMQYFQQELEYGGSLLPLTAIRERVSNALQVSLTTVNRIAASANKGEVPRRPKRNKPRYKPVVDVAPWQQNEIRNVVYDMYANKQHITLQTLQETLKDRDVFNGGKTSLSIVLKDMGFKYCKDDPRRGLMELPHIALKRIDFLKKYMRFKHEDVQFVFLDETWIFKDGTVGRSWQDDNKRSVKKLKVGGTRYIVLHAGCENGFIPGAELVFASKSKDADYHGEMNQVNFLQWFENQLLKNLEEPSVIILDNASYHSTVEQKIPTTSSKKILIQEWLHRNKISYDLTMLKTELLGLVKSNAPPPVYIVDTLTHKYGHQVLRLPPYHCMFNAIEKIWSITKAYYRDHVGSIGGSVEHSLGMWREALNQATPEVWRKTIQHTENEIKIWWNREIMFDRNDVDPLIINVGIDDSDDEWCSYSD